MFIEKVMGKKGVLQWKPLIKFVKVKKSGAEFSVDATPIPKNYQQGHKSGKKARIRMICVSGRHQVNTRQIELGLS